MDKEEPATHGALNGVEIRAAGLFSTISRTVWDDGPDFIDTSIVHTGKASTSPSASNRLVSELRKIRPICVAKKRTAISRRADRS